MKALRAEQEEHCSSGLNDPARPMADRPVSSCVSTQIRFPNRPLAGKEIQMIPLRVKTLLFHASRSSQTNLARPAVVLTPAGFAGKSDSPGNPPICRVYPSARRHRLLPTRSGRHWLSFLFVQLQKERRRSLPSGKGRTFLY